MAPITQWNPATKVSRGNVSVGIADAVVNLESPKLTELSTGIGLDCSITNFNGSSTSSSQTVDWLCNPVSEQLPGSVTHSIDDLVIKTSGQGDTSLITGLKIGSVVYFWRRDGVAHSEGPKVGDFVWVWKAIVTSIDPLEGSNTFIGITAHVTVLDRSKTAVAIVT